jgi:hypothetical protein
MIFYLNLLLISTFFTIVFLSAILTYTRSIAFLILEQVLIMFAFFMNIFCLVLVSDILLNNKYRLYICEF